MQGGDDKANDLSAMVKKRGGDVSILRLSIYITIDLCTETQSMALIFITKSRNNTSVPVAQQNCTNTD